MDAITRIVKTFHEYCKIQSVDYVIVGGFSVLVFGRTRMTMDIEIIINHKQLNYDNFVSHFRKKNFDVNRSDLEALDEQIHGSFFEKETMFRVDLKGVYGPIEQQSIDHALMANFNGIEARFDNPNQIIAHKLKLASEQDIEDAIAVFYRSSELVQEELLLKFAATIGVEEKMRNFLEDRKNE